MKKTYIFKYTTKDGKFIGYHYDSFCATGNNFINAKRYGNYDENESPEPQLATIQSNFNYLCDTYTNGQFNGYLKEEVIIIYEELAPSIANNYPHKMVLEIID